MKSRGAALPSRTELLQTAVRAAKAAGKELVQRFRTKLRINEKPGAGLVTDADFAAERAALGILKRKFPHFGILTEESAGEMARSPGRWILDPLDGTSNYAHGFPLFCVSIAVEWNGEIEAGVTFQPISKEIFCAIRGRGAFANGKRMRVSRTRYLKDAFLSTGFTSRKGKWLSQEVGSFERLSRAAGAVRRPGSAALDLANVARGTFDGFWERGLAPWDLAVGKLLIEEAGGRLTDFSGGKFRIDSGEVLASNGLIHGMILREAGFGRKPEGLLHP